MKIVNTLPFINTCCSLYVCGGIAVGCEKMKTKMKMKKKNGDEMIN